MGFRFEKLPPGATEFERSLNLQASYAQDGVTAFRELEASLLRSKTGPKPRGPTNVML